MVADLLGDNVVRARDDLVDHIWCSSGHDTVYADPQDVIEKPQYEGVGGVCDDVRVR